MSQFRIGLEIEGLEDFDTLEQLQPFVNEVVVQIQARLEQQSQYDPEKAVPELLAAFGAQCIREARRIQRFQQDQEKEREP